MAMAAGGAPRSVDRASGPTPHGRVSGRLFLVAGVAHDLGRQEAGAHLLLDLARHFLVLLEVGAHVVLALADAVALVGVPRAGLLDDVVSTRELDDLALAGDARAVH